MSTGGALSTGGRDAQGDLTGAGAAGFATKVGFSEGALSTNPPDFCFSIERGFNTVALGPTVVVGFCCAATLFLFSSSWRFFVASAAACSSASRDAVSF